MIHQKDRQLSKPSVTPSLTNWETKIPACPMANHCLISSTLPRRKWLKRLKRTTNWSQIGTDRNKPILGNGFANKMGFYSLKSVLIRPSTLTFELARIADEQPVKDFNLEASLKHIHKQKLAWYWTQVVVSINILFKVCVLMLSSRYELIWINLN